MSAPRGFTQRWWWYRGCLFARRLPLARRKGFLEGWHDAWELFNPVRNFIFYAKHPRLYLYVRRHTRLLRSGRTEIEL